MHKYVCLAVLLKQLRAEWKETAELDAMSDFEIGRASPDGLFQRAGPYPGQVVPSGAHALERGDHLHHKVGILLVIDPTNSEQLNAPTPVSFDRVQDDVLDTGQ